MMTVSQDVLEETWDFLRSRGREGLEGTLLWVGVTRDGSISVTRTLIPEQVATKGPQGVSVDLTPHAHYTLTDGLTPEERILVRVHSHPHRAYHSAKDNANPVITHEGALSIVVPDFASGPVDLGTCAVYRFRRATGWSPLSVAEILQAFSVQR